MEKKFYKKPVIRLITDKKLATRLAAFYECR